MLLLIAKFIIIFSLLFLAIGAAALFVLAATAAVTHHFLDKPKPKVRVDK